MRCSLRYFIHNSSHTMKRLWNVSSISDQFRCLLHLCYPGDGLAREHCNIVPGMFLLTFNSLSQRLVRSDTMMQPEIGMKEMQSEMYDMWRDSFIRNVHCITLSLVTSSQKYWGVRISGKARFTLTWNNARVQFPWLQTRLHKIVFNNIIE